MFEGKKITWMFLQLYQLEQLSQEPSRQQRL